MKEVGIFEAKTKLTRLTDYVARTGNPVLIRKRGRPLVVLSRPDSVGSGEKKDILADWEAWENEHPHAGEEFPEVWKLREGSKKNPLTE